MADNKHCNSENLVSVVVPIYNVAQYLQRCIDSIVNQSYKNLEIILVDDGSTDKSGQICDAAAISDHRIAVIHKKNGGLSSARNCGIKNAHGKYICFIDSDDVIADYFVEVLLELCIDNHAQISMGKFQTFVNEIAFDNNVHAPNHIYQGGESVELLINGSYVQYVVACNKLYEKSLFEDIRYPIGLLHEDEGTTYKLFYKANKVIVTDRIVYGYFRREDSITKSKYSIKRLDFLKIAYERYRYFEEKGESRLRDLFLFMYAFACLNVYPKVKRDLARKDIAARIKHEYYKALPNLLKSEHLSVRRKSAILIFSVIPTAYEKFINHSMKG